MSLYTMLTARKIIAMMIPIAASIPTTSSASVDTNILSKTMVVESLGGLPPVQVKHFAILLMDSFP